MPSSKKESTAGRHHGGPGSSHQRPDLQDPTEERGPAPGEPTNGRQSGVSGGGGVRDSHHAHDARDKGGRN
jgi:hypothetical protein